MTVARVFALVWGALAVSWGLFLIIRRNWLSELAQELKRQNGMRIAFFAAGLVCLGLLIATV